MTHAALSRLGQVSTGLPSNPPSQQNAVGASLVRPVGAVTAHPSGMTAVSPAAHLPVPPASPSPHPHLPSALHPQHHPAVAPFKSAEPTASVVPLSSPMQTTGTHLQPAQQFHHNHNQQVINPAPIRQASAAPTTTLPSSSSSSQQPVVPVTTAVSSPLLVNLLQQQQQQQQQQMARNSLSGVVGSSTSSSPTLVTAGLSTNPISATGSSDPSSASTSPASMEANPSGVTLDPLLEKVRQSGRVGAGRSQSLNSPLSSSSPSVSPYHTSPNSPTTMVPVSSAVSTTETNLTLAASVTVLNVRTGAPLNTALSNLAPLQPPPVPSASFSSENGDQVNIEFITVFTILL